MTTLRSPLFLVLACLSSCTTWSLEELRETRSRGTPFQTALAKEYLAFSEAEAQNYDWADSSYFADKGLLAAYGNPVQPEKPENWNIPQSQRSALQSARSRLMTILGEKANAMPEIAARAQLGYDCWIEQQEEAWQEDQITECRHIYDSAMEQLGSTGPMATLPDDVIRTSAYIVFFDYNATALTPEAEALIENVLEAASRTPAATYILNGHTDRVGSDSYNMRLSEERALAVRDALIAGGIDPARIEYFAFGETDPDIPTADGVQEPANRRVELFLE